MSFLTELKCAGGEKRAWGLRGGLPKALEMIFLQSHEGETPRRIRLVFCVAFINHSPPCSFAQFINAMLLMCGSGKTVHSNAANGNMRVSELRGGAIRKLFSFVWQ